MSANQGPTGLCGAQFQAVFVRSRSAGIGWTLWGFLPHFLPSRTAADRLGPGAREEVDLRYRVEADELTQALHAVCVHRPKQSGPKWRRTCRSVAPPALGQRRRRTVRPA